MKATLSASSIVEKDMPEKGVFDLQACGVLAESLPASEWVGKSFEVTVCGKAVDLA